MLRLLVVVSLMVATILLFSCSKAKPSVVIVKEPLSVKTRHIEDLKPGEKSPLGEDEEAITDWQFGCKTDFRFDIVEKSELADEFLVTVKIREARVRLDAPVTVWISKNADPDLVEHENAHVEICRRVYSEAEPIVRAGARTVTRREFQGTGQSVDAAVKEGLARASKEICRYYHLQMVEKINRVSEVFDTLDRDNPKMDHKKLLELAFKKYSLIED